MQATGSKLDSKKIVQYSRGARIYYNITIIYLSLSALVSSYLNTRSSCDRLEGSVSLD